MREELTAGGHSFEAVDDVTYGFVSRREVEESSSPVEVVKIRGLNTTKDASHDVHIANYGNGDGHLHIGAPRGMQRREDPGKAPGFKIVFSAKMESGLSEQHQQDMAHNIAYYWGKLAVSPYKIHDLMGLVKDGNKANFYYRIIPDMNDFGLNYESGDVCGGMAKFLDMKAP